MEYKFKWLSIGDKHPPFQMNADDDTAVKKREETKTSLMYQDSFHFSYTVHINPRVISSMYTGMYTVFGKKIDLECNIYVAVCAFFIGTNEPC